MWRGEDVKRRKQKVGSVEVGMGSIDGPPEEGGILALGWFKMALISEWLGRRKWWIEGGLRVVTYPTTMADRATFNV